MTRGVVRDHTPPAVRNSGNRRPCRLGWTYGERFAGGTCSARTPHGAAQRLRRALGSAVSFDQQSGPAIPAVWYGTTLHALSGPHRSGDTAGLAECGSGATRKKRKARGTTPEPWQAAAFTAPESAGPGQQERWSAARDTRPVRVDGPRSGHNQEAMPDLHRTGGSNGSARLDSSERPTPTFPREGARGIPAVQRLGSRQAVHLDRP